MQAVWETCFIVLCLNISNVFVFWMNNLCADISGVAPWIKKNVTRPWIHHVVEMFGFLWGGLSFNFFLLFALTWLHVLFCFFNAEMVPNDVQGELKHLYAAAGELLRHFWSCFPVNTPFLEEKVTSVQWIDVICDILYSMHTLNVILPLWTLRESVCCGKTATPT